MLVQSITGQNLDTVLTQLKRAALVAASNIGTGVAVLVATAGWGPTNDPTQSGNKTEWAALHGTYHTDDDDNETDGYAQVMGFFDGGKSDFIAGGGSDLRFIRIASDTAAKASGTIVDNAGSPAVVGTLAGRWVGHLGNDISRTVEDGDGRLAVPSVPALSASGTGGTLATGTVYVKVTGLNNRGETTGSVTASIAVTGPTGSVTVTPAAWPAGTTHWNVYAGTTSTALLKITGTKQPIATTTYVIAAVPGTGALPTTNTAATTFHLTIVPFGGAPNEVFKNLTPATAADVINDETDGSKYVTYTPGVSTLLPTPGTAFLAGGDSGLDVDEDDYIGIAGLAPTGLECAATVADANFIITPKMTAAVKTKLASISTSNYVATVVGPDSASVDPDTAGDEALGIDNWGVAYLYGYQKWKNTVSGVTQNILPLGHVVGALCNGPYWVNLTQTKLQNLLGPTNPLSETVANKLAGKGVIPITAGSVCRKGCNTSTDPSINQIEDFRIPVYLAKTLDATVRPLLGHPQDYNAITGESDFFDNIREACEQVIRNQPKEAIRGGYVDAHYDQSLAEQNKALVKIEIGQTGKANQIILAFTEGRTALRVLPPGMTLITAA